MDYFVYLVYRTFVGVVQALPLGWVYRLGSFLGWLGYALFAPYRRLAIHNLAIAYGDAKPPAEIRALARRHFRHLGANLLSSVKAASFGAEELHRVVRVDGMEHIRVAFARGKGVVLIISHIGNWELFAQLCQFLPENKWSTVYQPLGNRYIEAHLQQSRTRRGVALFSRKSGFNGPTAFLRAGGAVGVLVDQHAGDSGVWAPFFGRLASTSTLAALLTARTDAVMIPMAVYTDGPARWRVAISGPLTPDEARNGVDINATTAQVNKVLEAQINVSPADWFWVHNRWKTPGPRFLLDTYRRGIVLPAATDSETKLKPFRILVRSTNWLGDAVMTIAAVQAIARGRPDARVTVLAPEKIADLWRVVPGVAEVIAIPHGAGVLATSGLVRRAAGFDVAVVLPNSLRSALEVWLAGVPRRVGYMGHSRRWLLNQIVKEPAPSPEQSLGKRAHQSGRYAHIAREIGAGEVPVAETIRRVENTAPAAGERGGWLKLGLCPGAEYGPTKRWFPERFAEAARLVSAQHACDWVLLGTGKDVPIGEIIEKALEGQCENLLGKTNLSQLIETLQGCHALLTNDTGTMHLAAYLGVPTVAVFGSTDPILTGPLASASKVRIVRHQVECSPCFLRECPLDLRCMKAVTAQEVAQEVLDLLALNSGAAAKTD
jgi:heptosyltransferase-2